MLWVHVVRRRWKAREVKEADMAKAARGLFPPKGDKIEEIWVDVSTRPIWNFLWHLGRFVARNDSITQSPISHPPLAPPVKGGD